MYNGLSDPISVITGVPHGSALEPILFIYFINDIHDILDGKSNSKLFVDNIKVYSQVNIQNSSLLLQCFFYLLYNWFKVCQLSVNSLKYQHLHLCCKLLIPDFYIDDDLVRRTIEISDLGVTMCSDFRFNSQISTIASEALSRSAIISRSFYSHILTLLWFTFITSVRPILEYLLSVSNPFTLINKLKHVQHFFRSRMPSLKHRSYSERLAVFPVDNLENRRIGSNFVLYLNIFNNIVPITNHFNFSTSSSLCTRLASTIISVH